MSKATVLALVDDLSNGQADPDSSANYYDECLQEIAQRPTFAHARVLPVAVSDNGLVTQPSNVVQVFYVLYDSRPLPLVSLSQLEARTPNWRDQSGTPLAYTIDLEQPETLRLYPKPSEPSKPP